MIRKWTIHENGGAVGVLKVREGVGRAYQTVHDRYERVQHDGLPELAKSLGITHMIAEGDPAFTSYIIDAVGYPVKRRLVWDGKERLYARLID